MIQISLKNRTILVTGALGAIAEAVSLRLIEAGATLILTDVIEVDVAHKRIEQKNFPVDKWNYKQMDVTDSNAVNSCMVELFIQYPKIDLMIGLAGGCGMHPFESTTKENYESIFNVNYFGQVYPTRAILSEWVKRSLAGHIIYTSSLVAGLPWVDLSAYATAKAGVEALAKCLALEYADKGIRFNCVAPGSVAAGSCLSVYETDLVYREMTNRMIPLKRLVRPESIADAFLYLCSDMANDVNGQVLKVDCGASIPKVG